MNSSYLLIKYSYVVLLVIYVVLALGYVVLTTLYVVNTFKLQHKKAMSQPSSAETSLKIKSVGYNKTYQAFEIVAFAPTSQPPKKVLLTDEKAGLLARVSLSCWPSHDCSQWLFQQSSTLTVAGTASAFYRIPF